MYKWLERPLSGCSYKRILKVAFENSKRKICAKCSKMLFWQGRTWSKGNGLVTLVALFAKTLILLSIFLYLFGCSCRLENCWGCSGYFFLEDLALAGFIWFSREQGYKKRSSDRWVFEDWKRRKLAKWGWNKLQPQKRENFRLLSHNRIPKRGLYGFCARCSPLLDVLPDVCHDVGCGGSFVSENPIVYLAPNLPCDCHDQCFDAPPFFFASVCYYGSYDCCCGCYLSWW